MIIAGKAAARTLLELTSFIQPGITTNQIDQKATEIIQSQGCTPTFLNYMKFPNSVCVCVNEQVVHCLPSDYVLKDGDIITVDMGADYQGLHSDTAKTYLVGNVKPEVRKFVETCYAALMEGIKQARPGNCVGDISLMVEQTVRRNNYGIVKNFVGHGIGRKVHEMPQIPNYVLPGKSPLLVENMVICIEPIITMDVTGEVNLNSQWDVTTKQNSLACHFEHVIWIRKEGPKILTLRSDETVHFL